MLNRPPVFETKHLKPDIAPREIVFSMRKDKITIFERPHNVHPRRRLGKAFEQHGQPLTAFMGLRVVLDIPGFVDDRDRAGITGLDALEQGADTILVTGYHIRPFKMVRRRVQNARKDDMRQPVDGKGLRGLRPCVLRTAGGPGSRGLRPREPGPTGGDVPTGMSTTGGSALVQTSSERAISSFITSLVPP